MTKRITTLKSQYPRFQPQLAIIQAGSRPDSSVYVRMKAKAAEEVGVKFKHVNLPAEAAVEDVVNIVKTLNDDESISGILVQLPLGPHINAAEERKVTEAVSPEKDVDGSVFIASGSLGITKFSFSFHAYNIGHLSSRASAPLFNPCTPAGVIRLIESTGIQIDGSIAVVLGRSDIVGSPVAAMLRKRDATVTQCHSRTKNVESIVGLITCLNSFFFNIAVLIGQSRGYRYLCNWKTRVCQGRLAQARCCRYRCRDQLCPR